MARHSEADVDALVIGAGFAGLYMLHRLRDHLGLSASVLEAGDGVGGTWQLNRYPGARCDTESHIYCYSFSPELYREWVWSGKYPAQEEILRYLDHVADRFDLRRDIRLNTRASAAAFDDADGLWHVDTEDGQQITAQFLITAVGLLASAPHRPDLPGLDRFGGRWFHSGDWPKGEVRLSGQRVGVIGTGSTGVQMIPTIAKVASELVVFQRTAQFAIPARHHTMSAEEMRGYREQPEDLWERIRWSVGGFPVDLLWRSALDDSPQERHATFDALWERGGLPFVLSNYRDLLTDRRVNDFAGEFIRAKIRERVRDPRVRELLLPCDHPFGSKRPIVEHDYFETYNLDHVTLVDIHADPIVEVTPSGIRTEGGHHELDVIIFATGFDAVTGPFLRLNMTGRKRVPLRDRWENGPSSYLGLGISGFPNMFTITGPGAPFGNMPVVIEHHVEWIANLIGHMRQADLDIVEASPEAEAEWTQHTASWVERSVISLGDSWSTGSNIPGKPRTALFYHGPYAVYRKHCDDVAADGYRGLVFASCAHASSSSPGHLPPESRSQAS